MSISACMAGSGCSCSKASRRCCSASSCWVSSRKNPPTRAGSPPSNAPGSRERIEAEHVEAHARHGLNLRAALTHPTVWLLAVVMFCCQTGSYGLSFWVPSIVKGLSGYTEFEVGMLTAIPYIAAALGMMLVGMSSDRTGERFLHVAIPSLIGAVGLPRGGLHAVARAGAAGACRSPPPATTARAGPSGHCPESSSRAARRPAPSH